MSNGKNFPRNLFVTLEGAKTRKIEEAGTPVKAVWWNKDPYSLIGHEDDGQRIDEPIGKALLAAVSLYDRPGDSPMPEPSVINPFMIVPSVFFFSKRMPFSPALVERSRQKDSPVRLTDIEGHDVEVISRNNGRDTSFPYTGAVYGKNNEVLCIRSFDREGQCKDGDARHALIGNDSSRGGNAWVQLDKLYLTVEPGAKGEKVCRWWKTDPLKASRDGGEESELKGDVADWLIASARERKLIPDDGEPSAITPLVVNIVYNFFDRRIRFDETLPERVAQSGGTLRIEDYDGSQVCVLSRRNGSREYPFSGIVLGSFGEPVDNRTYNTSGECSDRVWGHTLLGISASFQKKANDRTVKEDEGAEAVAAADVNANA